MFRVLTEDRTDRQLIIGIQIGSLVCTCEAAILLNASANFRTTDCATFSLLEVAFSVL